MSIIVAPTAPAVKPHTRAAEIPPGHPWQDWDDHDFETFEDYLATLHAEDREAACERAADAYAASHPDSGEEPDDGDDTQEFDPAEVGREAEEWASSYATDDRRSGLAFPDDCPF